MQTSQGFTTHEPRGAPCTRNIGGWSIASRHLRVNVVSLKKTCAAVFGFLYCVLSARACVCLAPEKAAARTQLSRRLKQPPSSTPPPSHQRPASEDAARSAPGACSSSGAQAGGVRGRESAHVGAHVMTRQRPRGHKVRTSTAPFEKSLCFTMPGCL